MKRCFVSFNILLFFSTLMFVSHLYGQGDKNILEQLKKIDNSFNEGFTLSLEYKVPVVYFDASQGESKGKFTVTNIKHTRGIKMINEFDNNFIFRKAGVFDYRDIDYDDNGSLIIWQTLNKYALYAEDLNDSYREDQMITVNPQGNSSRGDKHVMLFKYQHQNEENIYEYDQIFIAGGRGFAKYISKIMEVQTQEGMLKVKAEGNYDSLGMWELTIDTKTDNLIRQATFITQNGDTALAMSSSGMVKGDNFTIAENGEIRFTLKSNNTYRVKVHIFSISSGGNNQLIEEIRNKVIQQLPKGSETMDFRSQPMKRKFVEK